MKQVNLEELGKLHEANDAEKINHDECEAGGLQESVAAVGDGAHHVLQHDRVRKDLEHVHNQ